MPWCVLPLGLYGPGVTIESAMLFAYTARNFQFSVFINGQRGVSSPYEYSFGTNEPASSKRDLLITDNNGQSYILDLCIPLPTCQINLEALTGGRLAHMPSRHCLYQSHIRTCGKICDMHDLRFVRLPSTRSAACTRTRPSSFTGPLSPTDWCKPISCSPPATPCGAGWAERSTRRLGLLQHCAPAVSLPAPRTALPIPAALLPRLLRCRVGTR